MRWTILLLILYSLPGLLSAQESPRALLPRSVTVTAGVGNAMGWFGAQGEHYLGDERVSLFVGLGYTPRFDQNDARGLTFAGGLRGLPVGTSTGRFWRAHSRSSSWNRVRWGRVVGCTVPAFRRDTSLWLGVASLSWHRSAWVTLLEYPGGSTDGRASWVWRRATPGAGCPSGI